MAPALRKVIFHILGVVFFATGATAAPPAARPWWSLDYDPHLATLGVRPDWTKLDAYQGTISKDSFVRLLRDIYSSSAGGWEQWIRVGDDGADLVMETANPAKIYRLQFSSADVSPLHRPWRSPGQLGVPRDPTKPLAGMKIAIDPGHIGGAWGRMEERFFQIGKAAPVLEGNMTLLVATRLQARLRQAGAEVVVVRPSPEPVSSLRPRGLTDYTKALLKEAGLAEPPDLTVDRTRNHIFAVNAEIRARAALVNNLVKPDLALCLHFNAEPWGKEDRPTFSKKNHLHAIVDGCVLPDEWANDDERFETILRLLQRSHEVEHGLAAMTAASLASVTKLPPYEYPGLNARATSASTYVWARNLLATRLYQCPVVFLEPHVMNNNLTSARSQAGAYEGTKRFGGLARSNIFDEYAEAAASAVIGWYAANRKPAELPPGPDRSDQKIPAPKTP